MTRENKLALVVGFGLILFVGILISDHFSIARTQATANLANQKIADPLVARTRDEPDLIALKPPPEQPAEAAAPPASQGQPAVNPSEFAVNTPQSNESMSPEQRSMIDRSVDLSSRRAAAAQDDAHDGGRIPQHVEPVSQNASSPGAGQAAGQAGITTLTSRESAPIAIEGFVPVQSESEIAINMKDVRFHDVRGGESLFAICKEYYDDTTLTAALAKFNKMSDASQIRAGRRLMIPPATVLGGKSATVAANTEQVKDSRAGSALVKKSPEQPAKTAPAKTYTVKSGDSLSSIALRFLGDREKWRDLHKLNRKVIEDPDNLKVGTVLRLL